jgi:hypothetical protein
VAKKVSLPNHLHLTLSRLAAKRDRTLDNLLEEIAAEWIRHTRALERRVGKSVFHLVGASAPGSDTAAEPALQSDQGGCGSSKGGLCDQVDLDEQEPTVH